MIKEKDQVIETGTRNQGRTIFFPFYLPICSFPRLANLSAGEMVIERKRAIADNGSSTMQGS
jgi:hypothetical protein